LFLLQVDVKYKALSSGKVCRISRTRQENTNPNEPMKNISTTTSTWILIVFSLFFFNRTLSAQAIRATTLKCEHLTDPLGIEMFSPHLSWMLESSLRGEKQTAYRILVASSKKKLESGKGDLWDSKKISSGENLNIVYAGKPLGTGSAFYWKVKVWDKDGKESAWSNTALWSVGLQNASDWKAKWIGLDKAVGKDDPSIEFRPLSARNLRKEFIVSGKVRRATAYICGMGLFELHLNGEKVGDQVLAPALSEYPKRAYYMTFDLTNLLHKGTNAFGVLLGNGRYFAPRITQAATTTTYGFPKLLFQLELEMEDGTKRTLISDETWKLTTDGPVVANNEYDGEHYDATKEMEGWDKPGFDDSKWMQPELVAKPSPVLCAQMMEPIRVMEDLKPVSIKEITPGTYIMDMGQNLVGWIRMNVQGKRGQTVSMRFAETLLPDGSLYLDNLRSAKVTDNYTLKGVGTETFEPRFTYHGFRYVEIKGYSGKPALDNFTGRVVYDAMQTTGRFETSNTTINAIYQNAYWGIRGNYRSIPTDCPQRDERQGWLGDRAVGSKGESYIFDNANLYAKWLQDIEDSQLENGTLPGVAPTYWKIYNEDVTWPAAYIVIADMLHQQFGNLEPMRKHYASMKKWMDYMKTNYLKDGILIRDSYGDWCMPPESPMLIHSQAADRKTQGELLGTSFYYDLLKTMAKYAKMFQKEADADEFTRTATLVNQAYNDKFFLKDKNQYSNNTATANLLSLAFGLVPEANRQQVFDQIVRKTMGDFRGHTSTGIIGAQWINRVLTEFNRPDIAYQLSTNTDYPSLGYMVKNGATTIWELWNGNTAEPSMNSGNHVMLLGDLITWYYENLAGIQPEPEQPGFSRIRMNPVMLKDLSFVKASHQTVHGIISSSWKIDGNTFNWDITVPANCTATVFVPALSAVDVLESGVSADKSEGVKFLRLEKDRAVFEIGSGNYAFTSKRFKYQDPEIPTVSTPFIEPGDTISASPVQVKLSGTTPGAEIRYTTDGSEPSETSQLYSAPFMLYKSSDLVAGTFKNGMLPSYGTRSKIEIYDASLNGYNYALYEGDWTRIPDFSAITPVVTGKTASLDINKLARRVLHFSLKLESMLQIANPGDYTFFLTSDDGSRLTLDGKRLIDNDYEHGMVEKSATVNLSKGQHSILLEYYQGVGGSGLNLDFSGPGIERRKVSVSDLFLIKR